MAGAPRPHHILVTPWLINRSRSSAGTQQRAMLGTPYPLPGGIMRKLAGLAGAIALAAAAGACSSPGSSTSTAATATPRSGTETITATLTGAPAASYLNSGGTTPPSFPSVVFAGAVTTTIRGPVMLGHSTAKTATHTFVTPAGDLTIRRTQKTHDNQLAPAGQSGSTCYFTASSTGVYTVVGSQSTGKFAGAAGGGAYVTTVVLGADLQPGRTTCSLSNAGSVIAKGTSITYRASGPLTLRQ